MKTIKPSELFNNLRDFLKTKGIELQEGSYTERLRQGCGVLADTVNRTQKTARRAKVEMEKRLDQLRQSIHEATAPKSAAGSPPPAASKPAASKPAASKPAAKPDRPFRKPLRKR